MIAKSEKLACYYARASDDTQDQSVPAQRNVFREYAEKQGYRIVERFEDDGISGTSDRRDAFQRMLERARTGAPWTHILVWKRNRFFRPEDAREAVSIVYELEKLGKTFVPIMGAARTGNTMIDAMIDLVEFNQAGQESVEKASDVLRGQKRMIDLGGRLGAPPYGYDRLDVADGKPIRRVRYLADMSKQLLSLDGAKVIGTMPRQRGLRNAPGELMSLVPGDPAKAMVVRSIFEAKAAGDSFRTIASRLNVAAVPAPRGGQWRRSCVQALIENPVYRGDSVFGRQRQGKFYQLSGGTIERVTDPTRKYKHQWTKAEEWYVKAGAFEGLVDAELWAKANAKEKRPRSLSGRGYDSPYLMSGLLRCACCGSGYTGGFGFYRCRGRADKGNQFCRGKAARTDVLDRHLDERLRVRMFDSAAQKLVMAEIEIVLDEMIRAENKGAAPAREVAVQIEHVNTKIQRLVEKITEGLVNDEEARPQLARLREQKRALEAVEAQSVEPPLSSLRGQVLGRCRQELRSIADAWESATNARRKAIVRQFVAGAKVDADAKILEIQLNPLAPLTAVLTKSL
jgi:site-specific DNA recombinase